MKKVLFSLLTVFIVLTLIEIALRLAAPLIRIGTDVKTDSQYDDKIRILTLGESTTDDYWGKGEKGAWPRQLESLLKQKGYPVKVFNESRGGTTTTFILSHVHEYLEEYRPHIVITMMGVNDRNKLVYRGSSLANLSFSNFFYYFKITKVLRWLFFENTYKKSKPKTKIEKWPEDVNKVSAVLEENKYTELSQLDFQPISLKDDCLKSIYYREAAVSNYNKFKHQVRNDYQLEMSKKAFQLCPTKDTNVFWYFIFSSYTKNPKFNCKQDFELIKNQLHLYTEPVLMNIVDCYYDSEIPDELRDVFYAKGIEIDKNLDSVTKMNYLTLNRILTSKNIAHIAMQYPTLSIARLKEYFTDEKILFVENRENFLPYIGERYDEVFIDRFKTTWGHTNQLGHGMIAKQVLPPVERIVEELSKQLKFDSFK